MIVPPRRSTLRTRFAIAFTASLALHLAAGIAGVRNGLARAAEPPVAAQRLRLQTPAAIRTPTPTPPPPVPTPAASSVPVPIRRPHIAQVHAPRAVEHAAVLERAARGPRLRAAAHAGRAVSSRILAEENTAPSTGSAIGPSAGGEVGASGLGSGEASPGPTVTTPVAPLCAQPERPARTVTATQPEEPDEARRSGLTGTVTVRVDLGPDGDVRAAVVVQSSGFAALDSAARGAAGASRYAPELHDCRPVAGSYLFVATFNQ